MTLETAMIILAQRGEQGPRYAYATNTPAGWLMRVHVTKSGKAVFDYASGICAFESSEIDWMKYGTLKKCEQDDGVRALDYSLDIPTEWIKPKDLGYPKDDELECQNCSHSVRAGSLYCNTNHTYTSPIMTCPRFSSKERCH